MGSENSPRTVQVGWAILAAACLLAGMAGLGFSCSPYESARSIADHLARDGRMDSFTPVSYQSIQIPVMGAGAILLLLGLLALVFRPASQLVVARILAWTGLEARWLWDDTRAFGRSLHRALPKGRTWGVLLGLTLAAAAIRLAFINKPFGHDEAYTFVAFAIRPLAKVITDYSLPNNHILHTILVHYSTLLFGDSPLAVRLPALLAGIGLVPAVYALGVRWYGRPAALLAAALAASSQVLIDFSTTARGYTLMALLTLLLLLLADYLLVHKNRFGWLLAVLLTVLGFYTLPMMLYPFGFAWGWLLLSAWTGDRGSDYAPRWTMEKYLVVFGVLAAGLTLFLYTPVFIYSGFKAVFGNTFVTSLIWGDFVQTLPIRLSEAWEAWLNGAPWLSWIAAGGLLLSIILHWKISSRRVPLQLVALAWLVLTFAIQRPNPMSRVWTYIFPLLTLWAVGGWLGLLRLISDSRTVLVASWLLAIVALAAAGANAVREYPSMNEVKEVEGTAIYIRQSMADSDAIAMIYPWDVSFWYYAHRYGIPTAMFSNQAGRVYTRIFVVVSLSEGQTAASVLAEREKDHYTCDSSILELAKQIGNTQVYTCAR